MNKKTYKNKRKKNSKTKKNKGGDLPKKRTKIPSDKSINRLSIVMTPSALYGNNRILNHVFINKKYPSFSDMVNVNVNEVEEFIAAVKKNKQPKIHIEQIEIRPFYKDFLEEKI